MVRERRPSGNFVGFQFDLGGDLVPVTTPRKNKNPILKLSKSRIETAAAAYIHDKELPDPKDATLPPAISSILGIIAHSVIQATRIWHNIRPRIVKNYESEYLHNVDALGAKLMPNTLVETAQTILGVLRRRECAMPYTTNDENKPIRRAVYGYISKQILNCFQQRPPFTAGLSLDQSLFPLPNPQKFQQAWADQLGDHRLHEITENLFNDHERNPFKVRGFNAGSVIVSASELRLTTWVEGLGPFSARIDQLLVGSQTTDNGRPGRIFTVSDWKTSTQENATFPHVTEMCDFIIGQMVSSMDRTIPEKRTVIEVRDALKQYHPNTAIVFHYQGYGGNHAWEEDHGSSEHVQVGSPTELYEKTNAIREAINTIITNRRDLLSLFQ